VDEAARREAVHLSTHSRLIQGGSMEINVGEVKIFQLILA